MAVVSSSAHSVAAPLTPAHAQEVLKALRAALVCNNLKQGGTLEKWAQTAPARLVDVAKSTLAAWLTGLSDAAILHKVNTVITEFKKDRNRSDVARKARAGEADKRGMALYRAHLQAVQAGEGARRAVGNFLSDRTCTVGQSPFLQGTLWVRQQRARVRLATPAVALARLHCA